MATIEEFEDIEAWKLARVQALEVFKLTQKESFGKDFALKNQMNNAAGSAPQTQLKILIPKYKLSTKTSTLTF